MSYIVGLEHSDMQYSTKYTFYMLMLNSTASAMNYSDSFLLFSEML